MYHATAKPAGDAGGVAGSSKDNDLTPLKPDGVTGLVKRFFVAFAVQLETAFAKMQFASGRKRGIRSGVVAPSGSCLVLPPRFAMGFFDAQNLSSHDTVLSCCKEKRKARLLSRPC